MIRNFARITDCPLGRIAYSVNDYYVGRSFLHYGEFSGLEANLFRQLVKPSDFVIDAGASMGAHSVLFARLTTDAGVVLAFEPQESSFYNLCANAFLNSLINLKCYRAALGAKPGAIGVPYLDPRRLQNLGGLKLGGEVGHVPVMTIDSLDLPRLDFLKIDCEGMEPEVIKGARKTIEKFRPRIYCETQAPNVEGSTIEELQVRLGELGYTHLFMHLPPLFNAANPNGVTANFIGENVVSFNMLALTGEPPADPYLIPLDDYLASFERAAAGSAADPPPIPEAVPTP